MLVSLHGQTTTRRVVRWSRGQVWQYNTRPPLDEIFRPHGKQPKGAAMQAAHVRYGYTFGYTLKAIAEYLGVHYTTVSRAITSGEDKFEM